MKLNEEIKSIKQETENSNVFYFLFYLSKKLIK
jgi:hypothetical protein